MSKVITYRCDRCGNEDTREGIIDLKYVAIGIKKDNYSSFMGSTFNLQDAQHRGMDMCKNCRSDLGIEPLPQPPEFKQPPYPTLEDIIREIVREETGGINER